MAYAFRRVDGALIALVDDYERATLVTFLSATRELLAPDREATGDPFEDLVASMGDLGGTAARSGGDETDRTDSGLTDPALARLLPTAHRGDDAVAAEFRRLTEQGLRQRKCAAIDAAVGMLRREGDDADVAKVLPDGVDGLLDDDLANADLADDEAGDGGLGVDLRYTPLRLTEDEAPAMLTALTDVRLLLGERLGLRTDEDAERLEAVVHRLPSNDPRVQLVVWYDFVTWLQGSLVSALMGGADPYDPRV